MMFIDAHARALFYAILFVCLMRASSDERGERTFIDVSLLRARFFAVYYILILLFFILFSMPLPLPLLLFFILSFCLFRYATTLTPALLFIAFMLLMLLFTIIADARCHY